MSLARVRAVFASEKYGVPLSCALLAGWVFIPYLGTVGLWDPWETHYAEVAREMLVTGDFVHPRWEHGWFFSKPALTFWLAVPGLALTGAGAAAGALSRYTEWLVRLPFALLAILAVALLSNAVARVASRRAGLATGFVLSTMPLYFFIARQAMTDMPFVASLTCAISCAIVALFDERTGHRTTWWRLAFAFTGVATLAKGLLGLGLPFVIVGLWLLAAQLASSGQLRATLRSVPWASGTLLLLVIAVPWYALMLAFDGRDPEAQTFFTRFFLHDHLARFTRGVHSPTPGGTFVYFIEQAGFGIFPWVALVPLAFLRALRARFDAKSPTDRLQLFALIWAVASFTLFTSSATRFHHYILPMLPALAVLIALAVDALWREPLSDSAPAFLCGGVLLFMVGRDLGIRPRHFVDLFTYNHDRPYPDALLAAAVFPELFPRLELKTLLAIALLAGAALAAAFALVGKRRAAIGTFAGWTFVLACWLSWSHWVSMSHHWTQRDLFAQYHRLSGGKEAIAAFWMDWKGETFYSRNSVVQIKPGRDREQLQAFLSPPGRQWALVEHHRLGVLANLAGPEQRLTPFEPSLNNKFVLVAIEER